VRGEDGVENKDFQAFDLVKPNAYVKLSTLIARESRAMPT
jgi:hypothetical protein